MILNKQRIILPLMTSVALLVPAAANADIVLTFSNTTTAGVQGTDFNFTCNTSNFIAGREFRMCDPSGNLGGGLPLQKNLFDGGETWSFDEVTGHMLGVTGTDDTSGAHTPASPAAPDGGPGLHLSANFFGNAFGFLAPIEGSAAANYYGVGRIQIDVTQQEISTFFPVLEAQWADTYFPLGQEGNQGVRLSGKYTITGSSGGVTSFTFKLSGEELINVSEDPGSAGFSNWTPTWYLVGSGVAPDSLFTPPNSPTANAGTLSPTTGGPADENIFNDGRASLSEVQAAVGVDPGDDSDNRDGPDGMDQACVGGCFDFTVSSIATGGSVQVVLPLTDSIPANAVYRKYTAAAGWHDFDTSTGDTIESGPGTSGDCTSVAYTPGLTAGHFCVRLTITDGGPNDADGTPNGSIQDPSGVGVKTVPPTPPLPGESLDAAKGIGGGWAILLALVPLLSFRERIVSTK